MTYMRQVDGWKDVCLTPGGPHRPLEPDQLSREVTVRDVWKSAEAIVGGDVPSEGLKVK